MRKPNGIRAFLAGVKEDDPLIATPFAVRALVATGKERRN
jgi:hypothetical protein